MALKNNDGRIEYVTEDRRTLRGWCHVEGSDKIVPSLILSFGEWKLACVNWAPARPEIFRHTGRQAMAFSFHLPFQLPPGALLKGELRVEFTKEGVRVPLTRGLQRAEREYARNFSNSFLAGPAAAPTGFGELPQNLGVVEYSSVAMPVGAQSADSSAAVGLGGQLFLRGGTNRVKERYQEPITAAQLALHHKEVISWLELIRKRKKELSDRNIKFLQMVQPEKSTILESGLSELGKITPVFRDINEALLGEDSYLSTVSEVESSRDEYALGMPLDSHLSAIWVSRLAKTLAFRIDSSFSFPDVTFGSASTYEADLSMRFFGKVVRGLVPAPDITSLSELYSEAILVNHTGPRVGHKTYGRSAYWNNPSAPIRKRVLLFGSSTTSDSAQRPYKLSYWATRLFSDFKFVWSPELDFKIIDEFAPDVVVSQVAERFLGKLPIDLNLK